MGTEKLVEFRTYKKNIRVADIDVGKEEITFVVRHKGVSDTFTLEELLKKIYGKGMRCVIYHGESSLTIID